MFSSGVRSYDSGVAPTILNLIQCTPTQQPGERRKKKCQEKLCCLTSHTDFRDSEVTTTKLPNPQDAPRRHWHFCQRQTVGNNCQTKRYELTKKPGAIPFALLGWALLQHCQYHNSRNRLAMESANPKASKVQSLYSVSVNKQFSLNYQLIQLNQLSGQASECARRD